MISDELVLNGTKLKVRFQPYFRANPASSEISIATSELTSFGELLTQPDGIESDIEKYFSSLGEDENFEILAWHIKIAQQLNEDLNIHAAINLHNSLVQNVSGRNRLLALLKEAKTPLTFEFTETFPMPAKGIANQLLRDIRKLGHHTALDDFGTGLNGMSLLTDCDFDIIKIDRSLTIDLVSKPEKRQMLSLILKMLNVLGREHVVEGVEDSVVYEILIEIGYTQFQGFLFGKPVSLPELVANTKKL